VEPDPSVDFWARRDVTSLGATLAKLPAGIARHPAEAWQAGAHLLAALGAGATGAAARVVGQQPPPPVPPAAKDHRFVDPAWDRNP